LYLHLVEIKHFDVAEEHSATIFRMTELIQVDAEFSYCKVGGGIFAIFLTFQHQLM